jgi:ribosomal-protein-alanine N-acetyltransferase
MDEDDLEQVLRIEKAAYTHPWTPGIFRDSLRAGYCAWVVENQSAEIIGYGVMSVAAGEAQLLNLCIHPDYQRRGLGEALLRHLIGLAAYHGAQTLFLEVRASNLAAYRIYHRAGFNEVGVRRNYYPAKKGREDALLLALTLAVEQA